MKFFPLCLTALLLSSASLFAQARQTNPAQNQTQPGNGNNNNANPANQQNPIVPMWRCTLPGGTYEVKVPSITAVSTHEYLVDGVARVTELNIDTAGAMVARFYFIEPNIPTSGPGGLGAASIDKATSMLKEAAQATGQDIWQKVIKHYPAATHAHTVEYRLTSKDQVQQLFDSVESAFRYGKNVNFSISE